VSDLGFREILLAPSRVQRRLACLGAVASASASLLLLGAHLRGAVSAPGLGSGPAGFAAMAVAAAICALAAVLAAAGALRRRGPRRIRLGAGVRAERVSASCIVLRAPAEPGAAWPRRGRRIVIWRDAADADQFRRIAARARWSAGGVLG
jgi:hypothetical protein